MYKISEIKKYAFELAKMGENFQYKISKHNWFKRFFTFFEEIKLFFVKVNCFLVINFKMNHFNTPSDRNY